ncbi:MAG: MjaI family restriction endonuclease, partial [Bacteroidetes bacterium]
LQIKPVNKGIQLPQIFKEKGIQQKTHEKFEKEFGGKVFYVFSSSLNRKKVIMNPEVIEEIRAEISRLEQ